MAKKIPVIMDIDALIAMIQRPVSTRLVDNFGMYKDDVMKYRQALLKKAIEIRAKLR